MGAFRVILIGNYAYDHQESMLRFSKMLYFGILNKGIPCEVMHPRPVLNKLLPGKRTSKWLGYIDKFIIFPFILVPKIGFFRKKSPMLLHITDHSNAPYFFLFSKLATVVTCHDLLAIKAALGMTPEYKTRWSGRVLQKMILKGIRHACHIVCDSERTKEDVAAIMDKGGGESSVIHVGFHYPYGPMEEDERQTRVKAMLLDGLKHGFLLHVGSGAWYKNRMGVLHLYKELIEDMEDAPGLVFVGEPISDEMENFLRKHHLRERVLSIPKASDEDLQALYSSSRGLVMPSLYEGFGWPVIEALACGCPVATTDEGPMTEVGGDAAFYMPKVSGTDEATLSSWAKDSVSVLSQMLEMGESRKEIGFKHARAFDTEVMVERYLKLYDRVYDSVTL